jgi:hypothetical protein
MMMIKFPFVPLELAIAWVVVTVALVLFYRGAKGGRRG